MSRVALAVVVAVQLAVLLGVSLLIGDNGWDDGAITLSFARTFAEHGKVALTAHSETVEGFSSAAWFFLNALAALARPSYHGAILVSQILAALFIAASTALLGRICAVLRMDKLAATATVVMFAAWGCSFSEASNGMEMGLLAAALLLIVHELVLPQPRGFLLAIGVIVAVSTRFEAALYVGLVALTALPAPRRRAFWIMLVAGLVTALSLSVWRLATFSDLLPNTIWAKRWPPYATLDVMGRLEGAVEMLGFFLVPLIVLELAVRFGFDLAAVLRERRRAWPVLGSAILGAVLMGALTGKNWGYDGRMPYFAFPIVLLSLVLLFSAWVSEKKSRFRIAMAAGACVAAVGMSMKGFPSGPLDAAFHGGSFGVSPRSYAETGQVFRRFMAAADLRRMTILSPDVGGLALAHDEFRIVDLAMLSNRTLARRGPAALAEVLETESPEMLEAHWRWASSGNLYGSAYFRAHYLPAFAGRTKLWIRRDMAEAIERKGRGCRVPVDRTFVREALEAHRYADHDLPEDRKTFAVPGTVFALKQTDAGTEGWCP